MIAKIEDHSALGLFKILDDFMTENKIPWINCVGFASDGAAVMRAENNSVKNLILQQNPLLYDIWCLDHCSNLISSWSSKVAIPKEIEWLLKNSYSYFSLSYKRI